MKYIICILLLLQDYTTYSQVKEFEIEKFNLLQEKKESKIFFTAMWCLPCMKKYQSLLSDFSKDTIYNHYFVFDNVAFSIKKLKSISGILFDSSKIYVLPLKYYKTKGLILNASSKALKKFIIQIKSKFSNNNEVDKLWFGDILTIYRDNTVSLKKVNL